MKRALAAVAALFLLVWSVPASAHKPSDSYLSLAPREGALFARWDIALRDLEYAVQLDADGNGEITWGELRARHRAVERYAYDRLAIRGDGRACAFAPSDLATVEHSDGAYAVLEFRACEAESRAIDVDYRLLFELDQQHRGLVHLAGRAARTAIFTPAATSQRLELGDARDDAGSFLAAVREGVAHILSGWDHLLFLLVLLFPSVLRRENGRWVPVTGLGPAATDVLRIVTAFTLAHSITLSLAALDVLRLPSRFVESAIAASIVVAALNNVFPILKGKRWTAAFALGLLHGFGFSAVLVDLGLPRVELVRVLFGFNVGVEIGQAAVVAAFLPLAYWARRSPSYQRAGLVGGGVAIALLAAVWVVERATGLALFS
jgi:HupE / UreJ protein